MTHLKIKILAMKVKKLVLIKATTSPWFSNDKCTKSLFFMFYYNQNEKGHIRGKINRKKEKYLYVESVLLLLWFAKN